MKINTKMPMYKIDSCPKKIKYQTFNVCKRPDYHAVCNKPIVDRKLLTHKEYLNMLATPKGFKWTGIESYYTKMRENYKHKLNDYDRWKQIAYEKKSVVSSSKPINRHKSDKLYNQRKDKYKMHDFKLPFNHCQQRINYVGRNYAHNRDINKANQYNKKNQKEIKVIQKSKNANKYDKYYKKVQNKSKTISQRNNFNKIEVQNKIKTKEQLEISNDLTNGMSTQIHINEDNSTEKLKKIKEKREADYLLNKKKQILLLAENKQKKREENEKKIELKKRELEEERKNQQIKKEKEEMAKLEINAEKEKLENGAKLRKKAKKNLRRIALKCEANKIIDEEEKLRNLINQKFDLKMGLMLQLNNYGLFVAKHILSNENENLACKSDRKRFIQCTKKLLSKINKNNQVFDPGNLIKQIIKKELNMTQNKQNKIKLKKSLAAYTCNMLVDSTKNIQLNETEDEKEYNFEKT